MDRRRFLVTSLAGALAAPRAAGAQQARRIYRIGTLHTAVPRDASERVTALEHSLASDHDRALPSVGIVRADAG